MSTPPSPSSILDVNETILKAYELMLPAFCLENMCIEDVVEFLSEEAAVADKAVSLSARRGIPIVFFDPTYRLNVCVTLNFEDGVSLGEALDELAERTRLQVTYHATGIVVWQPAPPADSQPTVASNQSQKPGEALIPGLPALPDPPYSVPYPPGATKLLNASAAWDEIQTEIIARFPLVAVEGTPANRAFVRAFRESAGAIDTAQSIAERVFDASNREQSSYLTEPLPVSILPPLN